MASELIKRLGIFALVVLAGIIVALSATQLQYAFNGRPLLAQVGVELGVPANPYNTLNDQLDQKKAFLDEREAYLDQKEAMLANGTGTGSAVTPENVGYLTIGVIAVALMLMVNFYLDWRRERRAERDTIKG